MGSRSGVRSSVSLTPIQREQEKKPFPPKCSVLLIPNFVCPQRSPVSQSLGAEKEARGCEKKKKKRLPQREDRKNRGRPQKQSIQSPPDRSIPVAMRFRPINRVPVQSQSPIPVLPETRRTEQTRTRSAQIPQFRLYIFPPPSNLSLAATRSRLTCSNRRARSAASTSHVPASRRFLT